MGVLKQFLLLVTAVNLADITTSRCLSTQYIEKGTTTSLKCDFPRNFGCVVWHKIPGEGPLITLDKGKKSGPGYESGDYDISLTGRLQINNVSLEHDRFFRVIVLYNKEWEDDVREEIRVHVYVKPLQTFPKIDICGDESYCLTTIENTEIESSCSVILSRPAVRLRWFKISGEERELESKTDTQQFDYISSSVAVTNVTIDEGNLLEVILCRALVTAPILKQNDAMVLLEGNIEEIPWREFDSQLVEIHDQVLLDIKLDDIYAVVWKKFSSLSFEYETIGHYAHGKSTMLQPDLLIKPDGSLQIRKLLLQHEGEYICIYARPLEQNIRKFVVEVFIPPSPPFTTIYGCTERDTCQMDVAETGSLTCTLKGIRPVVHVEWFYAGKGYAPINFINPKTSVKKKGPIFDITVKTYFEIVQERLSGDFNVSCRALGLSEKYAQMSSSITLHSISGVSSVQNEIGDLNERSGGAKFSIALNVILVVVVIGLTIAIVWFNRERLRSWLHNITRERQKSNEKRGEQTEVTVTNENEETQNSSQRGKTDNEQDEEDKPTEPSEKSPMMDKKKGRNDPPAGQTKP